MSSETYAKQRDKLVAKSARRRRHFDGSNPEHRAARKARRELGGAFGKADDKDYRFLALGTMRGTQS